MKTLLLSFGIFFLLAACRTARPVPKSNPEQTRDPGSSSLQFIDNVSINGNSPGRGSASLYSPSTPNRSDDAPKPDHVYALQVKYAILEDVSAEELTNIRLLEFMDQWYGTGYHYGGTGKEGIDCSAFVSLLMNSVYGIGNLPRVSRDQFAQSRHISKNDLEEGDLVFFHTLGRQKAVTHVGVYLRNNKFVHASVSGVMISDMGMGYYASHYVGAGRVRND